MLFIYLYLKKRGGKFFPGRVMALMAPYLLFTTLYLQAVHSAALRDNVCCTLRVCEVILNLLELLMDMGVLKQSSGRSSSSNLGSKNFGKEDKDSGHSSEQDDIREGYSTAKSLHEKHYTAHNLVLNSVLRQAPLFNKNSLKILQNLKISLFTGFTNT